MHGLFIALSAFLGLTASRPDVYFIRHGEKPKNGDTGLSAEGLERAQCIRHVFGGHSKYDIGYILAQKPKKSMFTA